MTRTIVDKACGCTAKVQYEQAEIIKGNTLATVREAIVLCERHKEQWDSDYRRCNGGDVRECCGCYREDRSSGYGCGETLEHPCETHAFANALRQFARKERAHQEKRKRQLRELMGINDDGATLCAPNHLITVPTWPCEQCGAANNAQVEYARLTGTDTVRIAPILPCTHCSAQTAVTSTEQLRIDRDTAVLTCQRCRLKATDAEPAQ